MADSDNVIDFPSPDADPEIPGARWRSAEEREAFIAEHDRRTAAGESLKDLPIPIVFPDGEDEQ